MPFLKRLHQWGKKETQVDYCDDSGLANLFGNALRGRAASDRDDLGRPYSLFILAGKFFYRVAWHTRS